MNIKPQIRIIIIEIICLLYVLLFVYAAVSKISEFQNFRAQLGQSPLLSAYTGIISIAVPLIEIITAFLLVIPKVREFGMLAAVSLMILFTAYIVIILNLSSYVPCSCGGILDNMGWTEHLVFNIAFLLLGFWALILLKNSWRFVLFKSYRINCNLSAVLMIITILNVTCLLFLYYSSEYRMEKNNPFIRRFIQGSAVRMQEILLPNNMYYFAGKSNGKIYLANTAAPLYITEVDTALKSKKRYKIILSSYEYNFKSVQVHINPPFFYLMDGTVPIVFKGNISDWKAVKIESAQIPYFSRAELIKEDNFIFRGIDKNNQYTLGSFSIQKNGKKQISRDLLKKQIDGFFDCDGMLHYDREKDVLLYLYYYRNQFFTADSKLILLHESHTIDTTSQAKLKVVHLKERGERKLGAPPYIVNIMSSAAQGRLYVNSAIIGRFEDKKMWKNASIIDIYDTSEKRYLSSIYIYDQMKIKLDDMMLYGTDLFVLLGPNLQRYKLSKKLAGDKPIEITGQ